MTEYYNEYYNGNYLKEKNKITTNMIKNGIIAVLSILLFSSVLYINYGKHNISSIIINMDYDSIPSFMNKPPKYGLYEAMKYYNIKHSDIVYKQAILETEHFSSELCKKYNNLFGLYNSSKGEYYKFNHWSESVDAYKKYIQYRYTSGDYYKFLERIGYAKDSTYIQKLKTIKNE